MSFTLSSLCIRKGHSLGISTDNTFFAWWEGLSPQDLSFRAPPWASGPHAKSNYPLTPSVYSGITMAALDSGLNVFWRYCFLHKRTLSTAAFDNQTFKPAPQAGWEFILNPASEEEGNCVWENFSEPFAFLYPLVMAEFLKITFNWDAVRINDITVWHSMCSLNVTNQENDAESVLQYYKSTSLAGTMFCYYFISPPY